MYTSKTSTTPVAATIHTSCVTLLLLGFVLAVVCHVGNKHTSGVAITVFAVRSQTLTMTQWHELSAHVFQLFCSVSCASTCLVPLLLLLLMVPDSTISFVTLEPPAVLHQARLNSNTCAWRHQVPKLHSFLVLQMMPLNVL